MTTWVDDGMTISDNPISIIKSPEATYFLQVIKGIFDKYTIYMEALFVSYDVSKSVGRN